MLQAGDRAGEELIRQAEHKEQMLRESHIRTAAWDAWSGSIERVKAEPVVNPGYAEERYVSAYEAASGVLCSEDWKRESLTQGRYEKRNLYLIGEAEDGRKYYHRDECRMLFRLYGVCYRMEECAEQGADPCPLCMGTV